MLFPFFRRYSRFLHVTPVWKVDLSGSKNDNFCMFSHKIAGIKMGRGMGIFVYGTLNSNNNNSDYFIIFPPNVEHMPCMHTRPHWRKGKLPLRSLRDLRSR